MLSIAQVDDLPVKELREAAEQFLEPLLSTLPEKRLRVVGVLMVLGMLAGQTPVITRMARGVREGSRYVTEMARRMYRFIWNQRFSSETLRSGLYALG